MPCRQNREIVTGMALSRADVTDAVSTVFEAVPAREAGEARTSGQNLSLGAAAPATASGSHMQSGLWR